LRDVGLDFLDSAHTRMVFEALVPAPRQPVFAAITADPTTWTWFPRVRGLPYRGTEPHGVGTIREIRTMGARYRETIVAWDAPSRWAYRVDETNFPIAKALVEEWTTEGHGGSTLVRWTFAIDPRPLFRIALPLAPIVMRRVFERAMRNLAATIPTSA
jgi:uncharacterized protein YndB with AHSA1/START domain